MLKIIANGTAFNISWLAIVYSQSTPIAVAVVAIHLALHGYFLVNNQREWLLIAAVAVFGVVLDQVLFAGGLFVLDNGSASLAPLWLSCLWPVLATTFDHAFATFQQRPWLAVVAGLIGGSMSYIAGTRLSDIAFADAVAGPIIIGLLWAALMPALARATRTLLHPQENEHAHA